MEQQNEIIIYQSQDGTIKFDVLFSEETLWLTQTQIGSLFGKAKSTISEHIKNIFAEGELNENMVVRKFRTTTQHGVKKLLTNMSNRRISKCSSFNRRLL